MSCSYQGCQRRGTTREHIPPKSFFPKDQRNQLLTVKSCELHNNKKSSDDIYVLAQICMNASRTHGRDEVRQEAAPSMRSEPTHPKFCIADHLVPQYAGGKTVAGNIVAACLACNTTRNAPETNRRRASAPGLVASAGDDAPCSSFEVLKSDLHSIGDGDGGCVIGQPRGVAQRRSLSVARDRPPADSQQSNKSCRIGSV